MTASWLVAATHKERNIPLLYADALLAAALPACSVLDCTHSGAALQYSTVFVLGNIVPLSGTCRELNRLTGRVDLVTLTFGSVSQDTSCIRQNTKQENKLPQDLSQ